MITLGLIDPSGHITVTGVEAGSEEHIRIEDAPYGCRWCGRDLKEPYCPNGCGHTWVVDLNYYRKLLTKKKSEGN